jgi:hypothetical protein
VIGPGPHALARDNLIVHRWAWQAQAEQLRHWLTIRYVAERVEADGSLDALVIVGAFAKGTADEASDLDSTRHGRIAHCWNRRGRSWPGTSVPRLRSGRSARTSS